MYVSAHTLSKEKDRLFMSLNRVKSVVLLVVAAALLSGCATRIGDFTMVTTQNVNMGQEYQKVGSTTGEDGGFFQSPDMKLAVDQALENAGSNATYITNARIFRVTGIPFWQKMRVTGDAWAPVSAAEADNVEGKVYHLKTTDAGKFLVSEDGTDKVKVVGTR